MLAARHTRFQRENIGSSPIRDTKISLNNYVKRHKYLGGIMKRCYKCDKEKDKSEFSKNKKKSDGLSSMCKECNKQYQKNHYKINKLDYASKAKQHRHKMAEWFAEIKSKMKCCECGEDHVACMDFHHNGNKEIELADAIAAGWGEKRILEEIKKCKVLCANCHRKLHWEKRKIS